MYTLTWEKEPTVFGHTFDKFHCFYLIFDMHYSENPLY